MENYAEMCGRIFMAAIEFMKNNWKVQKNIFPASDGCEEIEAGWINVEDDNTSDQNVKNSRIYVMILIIWEDFFQTWPLPSAKCFKVFEEGFKP